MEDSSSSRDGGVSSIAELVALAAGEVDQEPATPPSPPSVLEPFQGPRTPLAPPLALEPDQGPVEHADVCQPPVPEPGKERPLKRRAVVHGKQQRTISWGKWSLSPICPGPDYVMVGWGLIA